jgi:hypothetical protein
MTRRMELHRMPDMMGFTGDVMDQIQSHAGSVVGHTVHGRVSRAVRHSWVVLLAGRQQTEGTR